MARRAAKRSFNIHEAKTGLSKLVERVEAGEEITIARAGRPVARLVAVDAKRPRRRLGWMKGQLAIPDDFDRPLPESPAEGAIIGPARARFSSV